LVDTTNGTETTETEDGAEAPGADEPRPEADQPSAPTAVLDPDPGAATGERVPTGETPAITWTSPESTSVDGPVAPSPPRPTAAGEGGSWAVRIILILGIVVVLAVLAFVVVVVSSRSGPGAEPARAEAEAFVRAWSGGDTAGMQALVEPVGAPVAADLEATLGGLPVTKTTVTLVPGPLTGEGDLRTAKVTVELTAPELPPITYDNTITFRKIDDDNNFRVQWSHTTIHPELTGDRKFDRISTWAPRGYLLDANGKPLATVNSDVTIMLRTTRVTDRPGLEAALASTLGIDAATVEKAFAAARASGEAPIKTVNWAAYSKAKPVIYDIGGLFFKTEGPTTGTGSADVQDFVVGKTAAANAEQAAALGAPYKEGDEVGISGLQASQQKSLGGLPATEVRIVDGTGTVVRSVVKVDGSPPSNVKTTIDPNLQSIAEQAVNGAGKVGLVVVDRNGGIKALTNSSDYNWSTAKFPPGSTFKVITGEALLTHGLGPDSPLGCPPVFTAAGQPYRNFEGEAEPSLTFSRAFTISCNTAFLMAAQQLTGDEMRQAVARFGFTVPYDAGIPMAVQGSFPDDGPGAAKSSMAIGQGRVESNPLHMASVAATVMTGQWKAPSFLADRPADLPSGTPLDPRVREQLEGFMRSVVESGTATAAQVPGKVIHGKTGTAEFGNKPVPDTHAWFVGYSGDLAIAIVVEGGGVGGRVAAPLAAKFFSQV
jgi:cell division protein FtsI/penicillin-binding protein 2